MVKYNHRTEANMERLALDDLIRWNKSVNRKPLIVWGARQTGKSYLIKELFAKTFYKNKFIYIDFKIEDEIREFCFQTANPQKIRLYQQNGEFKKQNK